MSDVYRKAAGHLHTFSRKKSAISNTSNPSLISQTTPTLAKPTQGFSLPTNEVSTNLQPAQSTSEQSFESRAIKEQPLGHDISRISLFSPQAKLTDVQLGETSVIQRDEATSLPPVPNYQLSPPSLLQPPDPTSRYRLGMDTHLQLDPQVQAMAIQYVQQQLNLATVRPALSQIDLGISPTQGSGSPNTPNPFATPTLPPAAPLVPAGAGPATPRTATAGDLLQAIMAVPAIDGAITSLQTQAGDRIQQDWRRLSTGGQIGVISTTALIAGGALVGVISDPSTRRFALDQLNGKTLPVPGLNWLRLEINTGGDNLMLGMHVDVGRLLPPSLGFGPSSPQAIGAPPQPEQ